MGEKGAKQSQMAAQTVHGLVEDLASLDDVLAEDEQLLIWAGEALKVAHSAKNK